MHQIWSSISFSFTVLRYRSSSVFLVVRRWRGDSRGIIIRTFAENSICSNQLHTRIDIKIKNLFWENSLAPQWLQQRLRHDNDGFVFIGPTETTRTHNRNDVILVVTSAIVWCVCAFHFDILASKIMIFAQAPMNGRKFGPFQVTYAVSRHSLQICFVIYF